MVCVTPKLILHSLKLVLGFLWGFETLACYLGMSEVSLGLMRWVFGTWAKFGSPELHMGWDIQDVFRCFRLCLESLELSQETPKWVFGHWGRSTVSKMKLGCLELRLPWRVVWEELPKVVLNHLNDLASPGNIWAVWYIIWGLLSLNWVNIPWDMSEITFPEFVSTYLSLESCMGDLVSIIWVWLSMSLIWGHRNVVWVPLNLVWIP